MRLRLDRLAEPGVELTRADLGDGVALAVRPRSGLRIAAVDLAIAGQPAERRVHLAERQRLAAAEVGVVVALELITMARLAFQQAEKCQWNSHAASIHQE